MTKCCLCGQEFEGFGNNPWPLNNDENARCCDKCNAEKVIPARLMQAYSKKEGDDKHKNAKEGLKKVKNLKEATNYLKKYYNKLSSMSDKSLYKAWLDVSRAPDYIPKYNKYGEKLEETPTLASDALWEIENELCSRGFINEDGTKTDKWNELTSTSVQESQNLKEAEEVISVDSKTISLVNAISLDSDRLQKELSWLKPNLEQVKYWANEIKSDSDELYNLFEQAVNTVNNKGTIKESEDDIYAIGFKIYITYEDEPGVYHSELYKEEYTEDIDRAYEIVSELKAQGLNASYEYIWNKEEDYIDNADADETNWAAEEEADAIDRLENRYGRVDEAEDNSSDEYQKMKEIYMMDRVIRALNDESALYDYGWLYNVEDESTDRGFEYFYEENKTKGDWENTYTTPFKYADGHEDEPTYDTCKRLFKEILNEPDIAESGILTRHWFDTHGGRSQWKTLSGATPEEVEFAKSVNPNIKVID